MTDISTATAPAKSSEEKLAIKEIKKREGEAAMAAYQAERRAIDANTARLRELRLAKEAADREAALVAPPVKKATRARKKASA